MLRELTSDLEGFKKAIFAPGLNIAVARRTKKAAAKDSRNAVGKSSLIAALDFCLGSSAGTKHVLRRSELETAVISLALDLDDVTVGVQRSGETFGTVTVGDERLRVAEWNARLGRSLFGLGASELEPSYRALISYYLRNYEEGGFFRATKVHPSQSDLKAQLTLAYLFGLDLGIAKKAQDIGDSKKHLTALRKAAADPVLGRAIGKTSDIDARIATLSVRRDRLKEDLSRFKVVDEYAEHRRVADDLTRQIRKSNDEVVIVEHRVNDLHAAMQLEDQGQPRDHQFLRDVYEQVSIAIPDHVMKQYDEVVVFHESVVRNRRSYLQTELQKSQTRATEIRSEIASLDLRRAQEMELLEQGGALETYQLMQRDFGATEGQLESLREQRDAVVRMEDAQATVERAGLDLRDSVSRDLHERHGQIEEIGRMYSEFAFHLYGAQRSATLAIEPTDMGYQFVPKIGGDGSGGVKSMVLFCFDLAMAVLAHRGGRGPDFLVHDSHLFDGVESRQVGLALQLASQVCAAEAMQYIVTMNSDVLRQAEDAFDGDRIFEFHECATLTDEYDHGTLFGKRFD